MPCTLTYIFISSVHLGEDSYGNAFDVAHKELATTFVEPFHKFLRNKFRKFIVAFANDVTKFISST